MAPGPDGDVYVSIRTSDGAVVARLDRNGSPHPGWPIEVSHAIACGVLLLVEDGSIRVVCNGTDLPEPDNDLADVRAFAFDRAGRLMAGWPVQLRHSGTARMIDDELTIFAERWVTDTYDIGTVSHEAWMTTVAADGSIRTGTNVPMVEGCCGEKWAIGPDGVAYGTMPEYGGSPEAPRSSELLAVSLSGVRTGFPVAIDGLASPPAFDSAGWLHVTVNDGPERLARTIVLDTAGRLQAGGSGALGVSATDVCVGIEGSCEVPMAPLVGPDGTTFVVGSYFDRTAAVGVGPSGQVMAGWPYRSDAGHQAAGTCAAGDICEGYSLATPAIGPDNVIYLIHAAAALSSGGSIVAIGPDGRVRTGWPVELRRPGSAFWSVDVGTNGTVHALAIEPETGGASSASILTLAPDSTVISITTILEP